MSNNFASDYIDVATRIAEVRGDAQRVHPEGRFQPADPTQPFRVLEIAGTTYIAYVAAFYRDADDQLPGIGSAWEQVPGRTPYTRGSELQNAETSAWGRALIAALAADTKKGVASADEVRNRRAEDELPVPHSPARTTRHGGDPNATDAWTTPATDPAWIEDFRSRLTLCTTAGEVRGLIGEAQQTYKDGRLSPEDAKALKTETDGRLAELTGSAA